MNLPSFPYFVTRFFVHEQFYGKNDTNTKNVPENVPDICTVKIPPNASKLLAQYSKKKRTTAEILMRTLLRDCHTTIADMAQAASVDDRTIKRYLKEFNDAGVLRREGSDIKGTWILS